MGPIRCPETSVKDYHLTLRNTPEDRRPLLSSYICRYKWIVRIYDRLTRTSDITLFLYLVHRLVFFNEERRFGGRHCFHLQARKAPDLVDPLDRTVLSHWHSPRKDYVTESHTIVRTVYSGGPRIRYSHGSKLFVFSFSYFSGSPSR
jgi:hypothetical protein